MKLTSFNFKQVSVNGYGGAEKIVQEILTVTVHIHEDIFINVDLENSELDELRALAFAKANEKLDVIRNSYL